MANSTEFQISETVIPGLLEISLDLHEDARGFFQEKFQKQKLVALGFPENFNPVQQNVSYNREIGVTRGFHAEPWDKYVNVVKGTVHAVYIDLRKENFGKQVSITIDQNKAVFIPRGVANSFQTLEIDTYYNYLINDFWSPTNQDQYKFINLMDPDLKVEWPISLDKAIISDKDKKHPMLKDVLPF